MRYRHHVEAAGELTRDTLTGSADLRHLSPLLNGKNGLLGNLELTIPVKIEKMIVRDHQL
jgi:hypothetical protein